MSLHAVSPGRWQGEGGQAFNGTPVNQPLLPLGKKEQKFRVALETPPPPQRTSKSTLTHLSACVLKMHIFASQ